MDMQTLFQNSPEHEQLFLRIRSHCLSFPGTSERISHGAPMFYIDGKKSFAQYHVNHHGDGRIALWCAAPPGAQSVWTASAPEFYFVPPYVGHLGWVGIRLDRGAGWEDISGTLDEAYLCRAPKKYLQKMIPGADR